MAASKSKLSVSKKQSVPARRGSTPKTQPRSSSKKLCPGELALQEKQLSDRRFVWFPGVKGKVIEKIEFFTTREYHCLRIDFQDQTFLELEITPSFLHQRRLAAAHERRSGHPGGMAANPKRELNPAPAAAAPFPFCSGPFSLGL